MADRARSVEYEVRDGGLWRIQRPDPSAALGTQALQQLAAIELDEGSGRAVLVVYGGRGPTLRRELPDT